MQQQQLAFLLIFAHGKKKKKTFCSNHTMFCFFLQLAVNYKFFAFHGPFSPPPHPWCTGAYHIQLLCLIPHPLSRDLL
jgi:hypothetical protein